MIIPDSIIEQKNITNRESIILDSKESIEEEINEIAKELIDSEYNIGIVVSLLHNDETTIYTYGYADIRAQLIRAHIEYEMPDAKRRIDPE